MLILLTLECSLFGVSALFRSHKCPVAEPMNHLQEKPFSPLWVCSHKSRKPASSVIDLSRRQKRGQLAKWKGKGNLWKYRPCQESWSSSSQSLDVARRRERPSSGLVSIFSKVSFFLFSSFFLMFEYSV